GYSDPAQSKYILPYAVGTTFEIGQGNCGQVTHYGQGRFAYDFQMNDGTQILAVRSGIVEEVEESNPDSGGDAWSETNYVYIVHADGTMASYVHLQQNGVLVSKGDVVTQ